MWTLVFAVLAGFLPSYYCSCRSWENLQEISVARRGLNFNLVLSVCVREMIECSYSCCLFIKILIFSTYYSKSCKLYIDITELMNKLLCTFTIDRWLALFKLSPRLLIIDYLGRQTFHHIPKGLTWFIFCKCCVQHFILKSSIGPVLTIFPILNLQIWPYCPRLTGHTLWTAGVTSSN